MFKESFISFYSDRILLTCFMFLNTFIKVQNKNIYEGSNVFWGTASQELQNMGIRIMKVLNSEKFLRRGCSKMSPLRKHTDYVTCFKIYQDLIFSGSANGELISWQPDIINKQGYLNQQLNQANSVVLTCMHVNEIQKILYACFINGDILIYSFKDLQNGIQKIGQAQSPSQSIFYCGGTDKYLLVSSGLQSTGDISIYNPEAKIFVKKLQISQVPNLPVRPQVQLPVLLLNQMGPAFNAGIPQNIIQNPNIRVAQQPQQPQVPNTQNWVNSCKFQIYNKYMNLVSGYLGGIVICWDLLLYQAVWISDVEHTVTGIQVAEHEQKIFVATVSSIRCLDSNKGTALCLISDGPAYDLGLITHLGGPHLIYHNKNMQASIIKYMQLNQEHLFVTINKIQVQSQINTLSSNRYAVAIGCRDKSIKICESKLTKQLYILLGGSQRVVPKSFVENNNAPGASLVKVDESKIIAAYGNLIRVYDFDK